MAENNLKSDIDPINLHGLLELRNINVRENFTLRPLEESDASKLLDILESDRNIRDRVSVASYLHSREDVALEVVSYKKDPGLIRYVLVENDKILGLVSLWRNDGFFGASEKNDEYGFGYFLDPTARGKGLITDSITKLMDTVKTLLPVTQFIAFCESDNKESIAVLTRLGFTPTGEIFIEPLNGWTEEKYAKLP